MTNNRYWTPIFTAAIGNSRAWLPPLRSMIHGYGAASRTPLAKKPRAISEISIRSLLGPWRPCSPWQDRQPPRNRLLRAKTPKNCDGCLPFRRKT